MRSLSLTTAQWRFLSLEVVAIFLGITARAFRGMDIPVRSGRYRVTFKPQSFDCAFEHMD